MNRVTTCAYCNSRTKVVNVQNKWNSHVKHTRYCDDCDQKYIVQYGSPTIEMQE